MVMFFLKVVFHNCTFVLSHDKGWTRFRYSKHSASCWLWSAGVWCSRLSSLGPFGICSEKSKGSCLFFFLVRSRGSRNADSVWWNSSKNNNEREIPSLIPSSVFLSTSLISTQSRVLRWRVFICVGCGSYWEQRNFLFYFHVGVLCFFFFFFLSWKYVVEWRYFESINKL